MPDTPQTTTFPIRAAAFGAMAGLASAAVFYSAVRGVPALSLLLFIVTPLPSMIAAFGWGVPAAIAAAISGFIAMAVAVAPNFAVGYLLALGIPVAGIAHFAFLARYDNDGRLTDWYPIGRLLMVIALYGAALPVLVAALGGGDFKHLQPQFQAMLKAMSTRAPLGSSFRNLGDEQVRAMAATWIEVLPAAIASYWTLFIALNIYLAARIARASGLLVRPWPNLNWLTLPQTLLIALGAALAGVALGGSLRMISVGAIGALVVAYVLQGLSVIHAIGWARAPWIVYATYVTLVLAGAIMVPLAAITGFIENLVRVRARVVAVPDSLPPGSV